MLKVLIALALASLTQAADWRKVPCTKMFELGIGTYGDICDLEGVSVVCALQSGGRTKVFDNECHLKIANCIAESHRKQSNKPANQQPDYTKDYTKTSDTKKCSDYDEAYCNAQESCDGAAAAAVCGSNGKTYSKLCELKRAACMAKRSGQKQPFKVRNGSCNGNNVVG